MKVRYQPDNDLRMSIVRGAVRTEPRIDFRSAQAARLDDVPDPEMLAYSENYDNKRADLKEVAVST